MNQIAGSPDGVSMTLNPARVSATGELSVNSGATTIVDSNGAPIATTENGALATSFFSMILYEQVDGAALNTNVWQSSVSNMTIAQTAGFITLNAGAITTGSSYAILQSVKSIPLYAHLPLHISFNLKSSVLPQANVTMEFGIGSVSGTSAPTDGCFFRYTPAGQLLCVMSYGGVETYAVATLPTPLPDSPPTVPAIINDVELYDIIMVEDHVQFTMGDALVADIQVPLAQAYPTSAGRLPLFARVYTSSSAPANAPVLSIGQAVVGQEDMVQNKPWCEIIAGFGRGSYQSPVTAFGQTANHANSASPSSATLSNTAAGYTTLGGKFQFAAVAGSATDYALFGYQVPAGYQLYITGVTISTILTGSAIGLSGTVLDWSLGVNASAVSLATADGAGTWAPRRVPLGVQGFVTLAAIGAVAQTITLNFPTPYVVDGGRFAHIIVQIPVGLATASQVLRGAVLVNGYFE